MKIHGNQLGARLRKLEQTIYVVSGDEPLLVQEAADQIRTKTRDEGYLEREVFHVEAGFDWDQVLFSANSMSLFAQQRLLEIRMPSGKPGDKGGAALMRYAADPPVDCVLLVVTGKLDASSQRTRWFKALENRSLVVQIWPIDRKDLPGWIANRFKAAGLAASRDAVIALTDRIEGNLLAAVQEIERLRLTSADQQITLEQVIGSVADSARYNVFELIDTALAGDAARAIHILNGLRAEGDEILQINAMLAREVRGLFKMREALDAGKTLDVALKSGGVWAKRKAPVTKALQRLSRPGLLKLELLLAHADRAVKGQSDLDPWSCLAECLLGLTGTSPHLIAR